VRIPPYRRKAFSIRISKELLIMRLQALVKVINIAEDGSAQAQKDLL
jgi:hypothetical protein